MSKIQNCLIAKLGLNHNPEFHRFQGLVSLNEVWLG